MELTFERICCYVFRSSDEKYPTIVHCYPRQSYLYLQFPNKQQIHAPRHTGGYNLYTRAVLVSRECFKYQTFVFHIDLPLPKLMRTLAPSV
jgi:hypothetical protein